MKPIKIKKCTMTCKAFPSQWDVEPEDGREIYIRLRSGIFTVADYSAREEGYVYGLAGGPLLMEIKFHGEDNSLSLFGEMSTARMIELTKEILDFSEASLREELR